MKAAIFSGKGPAMARISGSGGGMSGTGFLIHRNLLLTTHVNLPSVAAFESAEIRLQNVATASLFPHRFFITSFVLDYFMCKLVNCTKWFFSKNMVNENLGAICNAHVVHADLSEYGALDEKCITLAELAATVIDFPKTGQLVTMPSQLKPKMYPDFMGKEPFQSYKSKKILGRLYRQIKDAYDNDVEAPSELTFVSGDIPYDTDLEIPGSIDFIDDAWSHKCSYDGQLNGLLGQYKVNREEEVVTGHIWSMPKYNSRQRGELQEKLKHAYSALRKEFRQNFEKISDFSQLSDDEKNTLYEGKASAWYQVTYHPSWVKKSLEIQESNGTDQTLMLSFCWIAADYLARIKIRCRGIENVDSTKPINSLVKYLADRI